MVSLSQFATTLEAAAAVPRVRYRSPAYTVLGLLLLCGGGVALCLVAAADRQRSWGEAWATTMLFGGVPLVAGFNYVFRASVRLDVSGIYVKNPWVDAFVAWSDVVSATARGATLRLKAVEWSVSVFAVQPSNWERGSKRSSRAQRVGDQLVRLARTAEPPTQTSVKHVVPALTQLAGIVLLTVVATTSLTLYFH